MGQRIEGSIKKNIRACEVLLFHSHYDKNSLYFARSQPFRLESTMHSSIPLWVRLLTIATSITVPVLGWLAFQRFARKSARALIAPSAAFVGLWIFLALTLSANGFFSDGP